MKTPETVAELGELFRRSDGGAVVRRGYELDFLPAAIEIMERPASGAARAISLSLVALFCAAVAWAGLARIDIVATAEGKIAPAGQVKTIQSFDTAVVKRILVEDGQHVAAGQVLIELDPTASLAEQQRIEHGLSQARLDLARLEALSARAGQPSGMMPSPVAVTVDRGTLLAEQNMLDAEQQEQTAKLAGLDRSLDQKSAEQEGARATVAQLEKTVPLIQQRVTGRKTLVDKQDASLFSYLELEQQLVEAQQQLVAQRHHVDEVGSAIAALRQQRGQTEAGFRRDVLDRMLKARQQVDELTQQDIKARQRNELMNLTAPVAGTVQQLAIHTIGGVVTPAQSLLVVVPDDLKLVAEARISNRDIGFVHERQEAEIKVATFDFTHYGILRGTVTDISRDAMPPDDPHETQRDGQQLAYLARVSLDRTAMMVDGRKVALGPGMMVTVEVKTGKRRVLDYLLSPVMRAAGSSLRER